ncbi:hypothetical protein ACNOYE_01270 [Nannocystaceae bacterium ST9]
MANSASLGLLAALTGALVCGCAPVIRPQVPATPPRGALEIDDEELSECLRRRGADRVVAPASPSPGPERSLDELPVELRRVVRAAGVESLLATLIHAAPEPASEDPLALELQLVMQLSSLEIQVASLLFETQCHGAQMDAVLRELDRRQRAKDVGLTVASILVGAVAATAGGIWELRTTNVEGPAALLIGGGVASAALGLAAFVPKQHAVVFPHPRNLLTPIVVGEDPERLYPAFVFAMLLAPDAEGTTIRDEILEDWRRLLASVPARRRELAEQLLYGEGGVYDEAMIDLREQMFDVLESHIHGIDQELELLYRFSARVVEVEPAATAD